MEESHLAYSGVWISESGGPRIPRVKLGSTARVSPLRLGDFQARILNLHSELYTPEYYTDAR